VQFGDQGQRVSCQDGFVRGLDGGFDCHSGGQIEAHVVAPVEELWCGARSILHAAVKDKIE